MSIMENFQKENGLLQQDFPVNHTAMREKNKERKTSAIFGLNAGECYANYNQRSRCLKTLEGFLPLQEENEKANFSMGFCRIFSEAGMMRNGKLYRLLTSERRTCGSGYGLWPTPISKITDGLNCSGDGRKKPNKLSWTIQMLPTPRNNTGPSRDKKHLSLDGFVKLFPTPTARDYKDGKAESCKNIPVKGALGRAVHQWPTPKASDAVTGMTARTDGRPIEKSTHLQTQVYLAEKMLPTPTTPRPHDSENTAGKYMPGQKQKNLTYAAARGGGRLNPNWVEVLMGYPSGWTDVEKDSPTNSEFPDSWLNGTWEDGIPRTASGIKNCTNRLKCLGNAIVPQISEFLWLLIIYTLKTEVI